MTCRVKLFEPLVCIPVKLDIDSRGIRTPIPVNPDGAIGAKRRFVFVFTFYS